MNKLQLFINNKQIKKLISAYKKQHFTILRFNKQTIENYNCEIETEPWIVKMIHERVAKNIGIHLKFIPIEGKILKSYQLSDLMEVFTVV